MKGCKVRNPGTSSPQQLFQVAFLSSWNEIKAILQQPVEPEGEQVFCETTHLPLLLFFVSGGCIFLFPEVLFTSCHSSLLSDSVPCLWLGTSPCSALNGEVCFMHAYSWHLPQNSVSVARAVEGSGSSAWWSAEGAGGRVCIEGLLGRTVVILVQGG